MIFSAVPASARSSLCRPRLDRAFVEIRAPSVMPSSTFSDSPVSDAPAALEAISAETVALGFKMASTRRTGAMLRALAASKPGGRILELGTGTGAGTAWLLQGMNANSSLDTVDNDAASVAVAKRHLGHDPRIRFHLVDGSAFLRNLRRNDSISFLPTHGPENSPTWTLPSRCSTRAGCMSSTICFHNRPGQRITRRKSLA